MAVCATAAAPNPTSDIATVARTIPSNGFIGEPFWQLSSLIVSQRRRRETERIAHTRHAA
jgi:hypothetical protein